MPCGGWCGRLGWARRAVATGGAACGCRGIAGGGHGRGGRWWQRAARRVWLPRAPPGVTREMGGGLSGQAQIARGRRRRAHLLDEGVSEALRRLDVAAAVVDDDHLVRLDRRFEEVELARELVGRLAELRDVVVVGAVDAARVVVLEGPAVEDHHLRVLDRVVRHLHRVDHRRHRRDGVVLLDLVDRLLRLHLRLDQLRQRRRLELRKVLVRRPAVRVRPAGARVPLVELRHRHPRVEPRRDAVVLRVRRRAP